MKSKKLNVYVICGGRSGEHEVSLMSSQSVFNALDKEKYNLKLIAIDKKGHWRISKDLEILQNASNPKTVKINTRYPEVILIKKKDKTFIKELVSGKLHSNIDIVLPIMHGTFGEDGSIQGFLELNDIPYIGSGVLGSSVNMDKDVAKRLLREAGIPICKFITLRKSMVTEIEIDEAIKELKFPIFVKPANLGSSVGVNKANDHKELIKWIKEAFRYDNKVILEEFIEGRELEISVLGDNANPKASVVGEIKPHHEFYSYEAKYLDENGADIIIGASLSIKVMDKVENIAKKAFTILECDGFARIDFFYSKKGEVFLNEINTIPGFTKISMYPKLWDASGLKYPDLLDKLIGLAIERKEIQNKLKRNFG